MSPLRETFYRGQSRSKNRLDFVLILSLFGPHLKLSEEFAVVVFKITIFVNIWAKRGINMHLLRTPLFIDRVASSIFPA